MTAPNWAKLNDYLVNRRTFYLPPWVFEFFDEDTNTHSARDLNHLLSISLATSNTPLALILYEAVIPKDMGFMYLIREDHEMGGFANIRTDDYQAETHLAQTPMGIVNMGTHELSGASYQFYGPNPGTALICALSQVMKELEEVKI